MAPAADGMKQSALRPTSGGEAGAIGQFFGPAQGPLGQAALGIGL